MNIVKELNERVSNDSNNLLLVTDISQTRKARQLVYDICKNISDKVLSTSEGVRIKYDDSYCYIYIFPNLFTLLQNTSGRDFKKYYLIDNLESLETIIYSNYKKKL